MNQTLKKFFSVAALFSIAALQADCNTGTTGISRVAPLIQPRSQSENAALELAGWTQQINLYDKDCFYGTFAITPGYSRTFNSSALAECLFGSQGCDTDCGGETITISGSRVANRGANDWLADNFYLAPNFQSTVQFSPRIENAFVDFNLYLGLDQWADGLFFRIHAPVVWSRWNLNMCESSITGTEGYVAGYFAPTAVPAANVLGSFGEYAAGGSIATQDGITFNGLNFAKIDSCKHSKTALSDLQMVLGWNFLRCEDYHLGLGLRVVAPTGNAPKGEYLFEPIVGNGKSWELGAQITSHYTFWRCEADDSSLGLYVDANITHLFAAKQTRFFDLKGVNGAAKPLSRYMLAERVNGANVAGQLTGATAGVLASAVFNNEYNPVANLTAQDVKVSAGVQGDLVVQLTYVNCGWNFDLGYNFWGRSCEKICLRDNCNDSCDAAVGLINDTTWALKGDAQVFGFQAGTARALSATESLATINAGTNLLPAAAGRNLQVDNAQVAQFGATNAFTVPFGGTTVSSSIQPVYITAADIDYVGTRGISNKIYTNLSYNWTECDSYTPYLGLGASGEWGSNGNDCNTSCNTSCNDSCDTGCSSDCSTECVKCAISQWSVWAKFGVAFN